MALDPVTNFAKVGVSTTYDASATSVVLDTGDGDRLPSPPDAWDLSTGSYASKSFDVSTQATSPYGIAMKTDGSKMYIVNDANNIIYQYSLSTAFDVSTSSYDSKSFSVSSQESTPYSVYFKPDGTKMFVVGITNDTIYQYSLSTAWDVSTASYDSKSFSVTSQETLPIGLSFKDDGTKVYICGITNDTVYQYSLSTAWDISTASYDSKSFSASSQDSSVRALYIRDNGIDMYIAGGTNRCIYQYTLSTAWDVSTASYDSTCLDVTSEVGNLIGFTFGANGDNVYCPDDNNDTVYQYSIGTQPNYNLTWWNSTDYPDPSDDPNREIVRVTARTNDTLTVTRGQEDITATTKNTASKDYKMVLSPTKKMIDDIDAATGGFTSSARAYRNGSQSIPNNTETKVQLNAESYDIDEEFDSTTNYRFTATDAGRYVVKAAAYFTSMADQTAMQGIIKVNGLYNTFKIEESSGTGAQTVDVFDILNLSANDYVEFFVRQNSGSARNIEASGFTGASTYMAISRIQ